MAQQPSVLPPDRPVPNKTSWPGFWKFPQQDGIQQAEDGGVRPNAEGEGEHGHGAEPGVLQQLAEGESEVVHKQLMKFESVKFELSRVLQNSLIH